MIRSERPGDIEAIREVTLAAFEDVAHSEQTEAAIVDALRAAGALTISLVAEEDGEVIGHVAISPVEIDGEHWGWFGLGPVSVIPNRQRQGTGQALVRKGLEQLREGGAAGCVVLGEPEYYGRFGFVSEPKLTYAGVPPAYFQRLTFSGEEPRGAVAFHVGFAAR